ncbi:FAD-binding domain-containing protein [Artomyces pyxidatus]|uniref:FAD-binding domain-containing protein n=1 Tax=Artomyces pyxidatus TaxID=48021 RepID=A0ACB8SYJ0_9AGAM|nr:FAD-binding domain-containing protein [Artomyces pyxidatus]
MPFALLASVPLLTSAAAIRVAAVGSNSWTQLNHTVGGRLHTALPFSAPCFSVINGQNVTPDAAACQQIQKNYSDTVYRASKFSSMMFPEWEACQAKSQECLLDSLNITNPLAYDNATCSQGSISPYYIDVRNASDVQAAFKFSEKTGVNLVIKNSGHDYKGRSSLAGALGLWVHNLNTDVLTHDAKFVPDGCNALGASYNAMTVGAGIDFQTVYEFSDAHNVTFVGGYHQTVVPSGGWVQAGGYSVLTPVYGLGIDRVLEFKIVTPDGVVRVANECQNQDLFWALRGGGGGTFGVVLEATHRVEKQMSLVVAYATFNQTATNVAPFLEILVNNSYNWGQAGWGGHMASTDLINVNPLVSVEDARASYQEVANYTLSQNGTFVIEELPSWLAFFNKYTLANETPVGYEVILSSRLLPTRLFSNDAGKASILKVLVDTLPLSAPAMNVGTPVLYNYTANSTSSTLAWRDSLWTLVFHSLADYNTTKSSLKSLYETTRNMTQSLRDIAPDSGSYFNEGDVYEVDYETSYWGPNYPALLAIKQKYDPQGLLDCWQCVGTRGPQDPRFQCYLDV